MPSDFDFFQRKAAKQLVKDLRKAAADASGKATDDAVNPRIRLLARQQAEFTEWTANLIQSPFTSGPLGCVTCLLCLPAISVALGIIMTLTGPLIPDNMRMLVIGGLLFPLIPGIVIIVARTTYFLPRTLFSTIGYAVPANIRRVSGKFSPFAVVQGVLVSAILAFGFSSTLTIYGYRFLPDMPLGLYLSGVILTSVFNVIGGYVSGRIGRGREVLHALIAGAISSLVWILLAILFNILQGQFQVKVRLLDTLGSTLVAIGLSSLGGYYAALVRKAAWQQKKRFLAFHGALLIALGLLIITWAGVLLVTPSRHPGYVLIFLPILAFGGRTLVMGRRWLHSMRCFLAETGAQVLLLRSFADDMLVMPLSWRERLAPWISLSALFRIYRPMFEECVVANAGRIGKVVAIADPEDDAYALGALRVRASDDREAWKTVVRDHMDASIAIFVICCDSHGLEWEISELVRKNVLFKTIFVLPPTYVDEKQVRWLATAETMAQSGLSGSPPGIGRDALCVVWRVDAGWRTVTGNGGCSRRDYATAISEARRKLSGTDK